MKFSTTERELRKYLRELKRLFNFYVLMNNTKGAEDIIQEIRVTENRLGDYEPDYSTSRGSN